MVAAWRISADSCDERVWSPERDLNNPHGNGLLSSASISGCDIMPSARFIDEHVGEAIWNSERRVSPFDTRMTLEKGLELAPGRLVAAASCKSRNSSGVATVKNFDELTTISAAAERIPESLT
jgi:hypothetical protein